MKNFEREGNANAYQLVETYYERWTAFILTGMVPQYLTQRVKYMPKNAGFGSGGKTYSQKDTFERVNARRKK